MLGRPDNQDMKSPVGPAVDRHVTLSHYQPVGVNNLSKGHFELKVVELLSSDLNRLQKSCRVAARVRNIA